MEKPNGYDDISLSTELDTGGHKCVITKIEETKSQKGHPMLIIYFDTDKEDKQPAFYANKYLAEEKAGKDAVWRGRSWMVTDGEYGPANLKRFCTAVEDSNEGFKVQWGPQFAQCFIDKKVGIVFRLEDYTASDGQARAAVKPAYFCNYAEATDKPVPPRKCEKEKVVQPSLMERYQQAQAQQATQPTYDQMSTEGFMKVPDNVEDEGLPFN